MKFALMSLVLFSSAAAFANPECFKIKNSLDRRYCVDKYLESVKTQMDSEKSAWDANGISTADRLARTNTMETDMQAKRDQINMLQNEIAMTEKQMASLKVAKDQTVAAAPAPVAAKKKKKHGGFRIKL